MPAVAAMNADAQSGIGQITNSYRNKCSTFGLFPTGHCAPFKRRQSL